MQLHSIINKKKQTRRPLVLVALILSMFMAAIEGTIVATAMPNIVADLGGFSLYSWVFSAFLLMQAVTILIFGKLSDLYGRKPIYVIGVVIFLIGSILCGLAPTMTLLVIFRIIQGIGAGAVQPIITTMVGDMYSIKERAKIQGYLASVWGISSIAGPLFGGFIVKFADWAWIFWLNIPLGILGLIGVILFFHEEVSKEKKTIDYTGASLFFISVSALIIVLVQGGTAWHWNSIPIISLLSLFILGFSLFLWQEHRAKTPMMPLHLWKNKLITIANLITLISGMIILGLSSFLPTYVQGVMGYSPIIAGFTLSTMSIGWPIASTTAGHLVLKIGFRPTAILGGIALVTGGTLFMFLEPGNGPIYAGFSSFVIGLGMGLTSTTFIVAIQNSVDWKTRGAATSLTMFMRIIGSATGTAILGGVLNQRMNQLLEKQDASLAVANTDILLNDTARNQLDPALLATMEQTLAEAMHAVFIGLFILGLIAFLLSSFFPEIKQKKQK
ncbi:Multidrug resistance protein 3 [Paraliobacillus sp. PM-2]|uniref:MDR family MFS transporter n=1 Tax=Paraliobacillus sp. PM-2 TaxID=1462524 RepID=UPI00061CB2D0|nr:MDR family MFS transporter [Paraliobacillus sp. PM-2]CQR47951.1 Multidrug resistance protein 3 [Paraliobacillus sp. PM-2]